MQAKIPHSLNVPGDFYVEDGCCTSCEMPFLEAPGHFKYDDLGHCYVCRQPATAEELEKMISAVSVAELDCIRYAGNDPQTLQKLGALKAQDLCDVLQSKSGGSQSTEKVWWALWRR